MLVFSKNSIPHAKCPEPPYLIAGLPEELVDGIKQTHIKITPAQLEAILSSMRNYAHSPSTQSKNPTPNIPSDLLDHLEDETLLVNIFFNAYSQGLITSLHTPPPKQKSLPKPKEPLTLARIDDAVYQYIKQNGLPPVPPIPNGPIYVAHKLPVSYWMKTKLLTPYQTIAPFMYTHHKRANKLCLALEYAVALDTATTNPYLSKQLLERPSYADYLLPEDVVRRLQAIEDEGR